MYICLVADLWRRGKCLFLDTECRRVIRVSLRQLCSVRNAWGPVRQFAECFHTLVTGLERREYGRRDPSCWPRGTLYAQRLGVVRSVSFARWLMPRSFFPPHLVWSWKRNKKSPLRSMNSGQSPHSGYLAASAVVTTVTHQGP
jgi:hypothetical protein